MFLSGGVQTRTGRQLARRWLRRPWPHLVVLWLVSLTSACGRDGDTWLAKVWGPVRDALPLGGQALALPADWTPASADDGASAGLEPKPIGSWQPFADAKALAIWQRWQAGAFAEAAKAAESLKPAEMRASDDRLRWQAFLVTTRRYLALTNKDEAPKWRAQAREALRAAAAYVPLRQAALEELAQEADTQGLSNVVLGLLTDAATPQAAVLRARAHRRNGELGAAERELDAAGLATSDPTGWTALHRQHALELARLREAQGAADKARMLLQPLIRAGKSAEAEDAVAQVLGDADATWQRRLAAQPEDGPLVLDALVYAAQRRKYARVVPALQALAASKASVAVRCHARSWWAKALDRQGKFSDSLAVFGSWPAECETAAVRQLQVDEDPLPAGDVAYRRGRALAILGEPKAKTELQAAVAAKLPGLDGEDAETLLLLLSLPNGAKLVAEHGVVAAKDYAERDIVDVVGWRVAQSWLHDGLWDPALKVLRRLAEVRDRSPLPAANQPAPADFRWDERDWARGRADYFVGRVLEQQGKTDDAVVLWTRVVERHPLSYYATLSASRLVALGKPLPALATSDTVQPADPALFVSPNAAAARLLGLLGWHAAAGAALDAMGLARSLQEGQRYAAGDPGGVWSRALIDDEAGRWTSSHAVGRDVSKRYWLQAPHSGNRTAWQVAYPRGFAQLMEAAAKEAGIDPAIVYAICRSESGFNPRVESHAAAIGLLQLILPTAEAMAKPLGLEATPQTLREPAVNTRLGARYLGKLLERFERESQMAAGYNAGGGAVGRWRKQRGDWPLDLFVEMIPFRETRDYAKRVQSAIAVYQTLYGGVAVPTFRLDQKPVPATEEPATEPGKPRSVGPQQALPKLGLGPSRPVGRDPAPDRDRAPAPAPARARAPAPAKPTSPKRPPAAKKPAKPAKPTKPAPGKTRR